MGQSVEGKFLVNNDEEFIKLFEKVNDLEGIERFLGVEFPYTDGQYASDLDDELSDEELEQIENQDIDFTKFRKTRDWTGPEEYPAVVHVHYSNDWDRVGDVHYRLMTCTYLSDFKGAK
jgi:hypothetical protein